ncbi:hypothetical protein OG579_10815 [Williamsia herbipolensis]|uniref:Transmembrane protein n=1 Tax=Williamsia herbipolensis TaxID=1603258 RepID=A0AAU4JWX5_9NOCA|nr:hypothetical protein [Williamsia herbipolensis]
MNRGGARATLWLTSAALAAAVVGPLFAGGDLLYRDAVSTPRSFVTDTALGLGDAPARAVPQDWLIAVASRMLDGSVVVTTLTFAALVLAGVGFGRLAGRVVPAARTPGLLAGAAIGIWNPFVAERLLQGQWSLLLGYAALGWVVLAAEDCRRRPDRRTWARLAAWVAVAGITPTGWVLAVVVTLAVVAARRRAVAGVAVVAIVTSLPWTAAAALSTAPATSDTAAVAAFAARAETGLGTLGTLAGLGGIWNADAVPASRTGMWALIATLCLLAVVAIGCVALRRRWRRVRLIGVTATVAVAALVPVTLAATAPGQAVLRGLVDTVPGAGLLRDTSKFVALLVPFYAIAAAAAVQVIGRLVPRGLAAAVVALLVVAPLPDLAAGVGGEVRTVSLPSDFAEVAALVPADAGDIAVLPTGSNRRYAFTDGVVSLDPTARLLRAPVLATGELFIDGRAVDTAPDSRAARAEAILARGGPPADLARLGVGWVLVESVGPHTPSATLRTLPVVYRGDLLTLYRVADPVVVRASTVDRVLAWAAHLVWLAVILGGVGFGGVAAGRGRRLFSWGAWRAPTPPPTSPRSAG